MDNSKIQRDLASKILKASNIISSSGRASADHIFVSNKIFGNRNVFRSNKIKKILICLEN